MTRAKADLNSFIVGSDLMAYPVFQQSLLDAGKYMNSLGSLWSLVCKFQKCSRIHPNSY